MESALPYTRTQLSIQAFYNRGTAAGYNPDSSASAFLLKYGRGGTPGSGNIKSIKLSQSFSDTKGMRDKK